MTVVAYSARHGVIASDSRISGDGVHFTTGQKVYRVRRGVVGVQGDADARDLLALVRKARPGRMPTRRALARGVQVGCCLRPARAVGGYGPMTIDDLLSAFLDDDRPTTPGTMRWVVCECTRADRFRPAGVCEACGGHGTRLALVEKEEAPDRGGRGAY